MEECAYCAAEFPERDWFGLEIQRPVPQSRVKDDIEYRDEIFCSQEHAARWLNTPLGAPEPSAQVAESGWVVGVAVAGVGVLLAGLLAVGVLTVGRWLLSLL